MLCQKVGDFKTLTMKTAMQELIDELRDYKRTTFSDKLVVTHWIVIAGKLLEKEKEQIINAWNDKRMKVFLSNDTDELIELENNDGEDYYNETYNQNK